MPEELTFSEKVYEVVAQIPYGRVTTYGHIARKIGSPQSARMVGWSMNHSHSYKEDIPAHRVVNRIGLLTGKAHFATPDLMQKLLEKEGVEIKNNQVQDFQNLLWNPNEY